MTEDFGVHYDWNFSVLSSAEYRSLLFYGFLTTLHLTFWCVVLGTPLGVFLGSIPFVDQMIPRYSKLSGTNRRRTLLTFSRGLVILLSGVTIVLIDIVRAIPLLLLILTAYYAFPVVLSHDVSPFISVVAAMTINLAAFVADLVRGAASAVSRGDILAARGLGMSTTLTWRRIILPEVFREILPGLATLYITMLKLSTLASTVAVYEVLHSADAITQKTYRNLELYVVVSAMFILIVVPLSYGARRLEQSRAFLRRS